MNIIYRTVFMISYGEKVNTLLQLGPCLFSNLLLEEEKKIIKHICYYK